jgi:hypothetical protein
MMTRLKFLPVDPTDQYIKGNVPGSGRWQTYYNYCIRCRWQHAEQETSKMDTRRVGLAKSG